MAHLGKELSSIDDPFNLDRFVTAQDARYESICAELREGQKREHWMWFVFPQLKGLGQSAMAHRYGISSLAEAEAYLQHPVLRKRLVECTSLANAVQGRSVQEIFGDIDAMKFRSSMTLFAEVERREKVFGNALKKYFEGRRDQLTLDLLSHPSRTAGG